MINNQKKQTSMHLFANLCAECIELIQSKLGMYFAKQINVTQYSVSIQHCVRGRILCKSYHF